MRRLGPAGGTWYVLNADGSPAFQLLAPRGLWIEDASKEWLWGVAPDEFDGPYMIKRRIVDH